MIEELYEFHMDITSVGYEHPKCHGKCLNDNPVPARHILTYPYLSAPLYQRCIPSNGPVVVVMGNIHNILDVFLQKDIAEC